MKFRCFKYIIIIIIIFFSKIFDNLRNYKNYIEYIIDLYLKNIYMNIKN